MSWYEPVFESAEDVCTVGMHTSPAERARAKGGHSGFRIGIRDGDPATVYEET